MVLANTWGQTVVQIRGGNEADIDDLLVIEDECFSIYRRYAIA